jgi:hypothetical protein
MRGRYHGSLKRAERSMDAITNGMFIVCLCLHAWNVAYVTVRHSWKPRSTKSQHHLEAGFESREDVRQRPRFVCRRMYLLTPLSTWR